MGDRIDPGDVLADEGARLSDWLGGLLVRGLALPEGLSVDQRAKEMAGARAAVSGLAGEVWDARADGGTGIVERVQAAQFVCAHAAAMDWQAEANRRDLPPHARATCQRLARQLMALTTAQLGGLCRLKAERRKERAETARLAGQAARRAERETAERFEAGAAEVRAMIAGFERTGRELARADREALAAAGAAAGLDADLAADPALDPELDSDFDAGLDPEARADLASASGARAAYAAPPLAPPEASPRRVAARSAQALDQTAERAFAMAAPPPSSAPWHTGAEAPGEDPPPVAPPRQAKPEPVPGSAGTPRCRSGDAGGFAEASGAGVPAPPPDPEAPLNRRQRRALERLRRKAGRREGVG